MPSETALGDRSTSGQGGPTMTFVAVALFCLVACLSAATLLRVHVALVVPQVLLGTSLVLYVAGIFNQLEVGFYLALTAAVAGAALALYRRGLREVSATLATLVSPALVMFAVYAAVTYVLTRQLQFSSWDEFSHWGTVVKAMHEHDSLSPYNPEDLLFRSYPPAAGLFEYFVMHFGGAWREGNLFWAYQLLLGSLFVPFMAGVRWRSSQTLLISMPLAVLTPVIFSNSYSEVIIDPLLGTVFGFALALVVTSNLWDWRRIVFVAIPLMNLVLMKDSGVFFACIVMIVGLVKLLRTRHSIAGRNWWSAAIRIGSIAVATAVTSFSWKWLLQIKDVPVAFSGPIDTQELLTTLFGGGAPYRQTVLSEFEVALGGRSISMYTESVNLSWLPWLVILSLVLACTALLASGSDRRRFDWPSIAVVVAGMVAYTAGLAVLYLFRFSEYEAVRLASFERYLSTYFVGMATLAAMSLIWLVSEPVITHSNPRSWRRILSPRIWLSAAFLGFVLFVVPLQPLIEFVKNPPAASQLARAPYEPLVAEMRSAGVGQGDTVWIIAQHTMGGEYWILRYELMPATAVGAWSIGTPRDSSDIWTDTTITPKRWATELQDVDFVALYTVTQDFRSQYADLFVDSADIADDALFTVDEIDGRIQLERAR